METEILKMREALDGPLGVVIVALLAYTAGLARSLLQEVRDAREDRAGFKAQFDRLRDESNARADREHDDTRARSKEDRALYMRENAQLSSAIAEDSSAIAESSKQIGENFRQIADNSKRIAVLSKQIAEQSKEIAERLRR